MKTHYALYFALLWGYKMAEIKNSKPGAYAADRDYNKMLCESELDEILLAWAEEYVASDAVDSEDFFNEKLEAYLRAGGSCERSFEMINIAKAGNATLNDVVARLKTIQQDLAALETTNAEEDVIDILREEQDKLVDLLLAWDLLGRAESVGILHGYGPEEDKDIFVPKGYTVKQLAELKDMRIKPACVSMKKIQVAAAIAEDQDYGAFKAAVEEKEKERSKVMLNPDFPQLVVALDDYSLAEFDSKYEFEGRDVRDLGICYTTITDDELDYQVTLDLVDCTIFYYIDLIEVRKEEYHTLANLAEAIRGAEFNDFLDYTEDEVAKAVAANLPKPETRTVEKGCVHCDAAQRCADAFEPHAQHCGSYDHRTIEVPVSAETEEESRKTARVKSLFLAMLKELPANTDTFHVKAYGDMILCDTDARADAIADLIDALYGGMVAVTGHIDPDDDKYHGTVDGASGWYYVDVS